MRSSIVKLGSYHITAEVARGGQATLYKAVHTVLGRETALKVLHPHLITVADFLQKFEAESKILAQLQHPNIVAVYDAGVDQGYYWIAMEWLEGRTVDQLIAQQGKLPVDLAVRMADQVAAALEYAHDRRLVHRDIKPANIMLCTDNTVKLLDFGIAALVAAGQKAKTRIGTAEYMSCEQFSGRADARSDLYSLGACMYHMLTGHAPPPLASHPPTPPRQHNSNVNPELEQLLFQLLARAPDERYQTAVDIRQDLAAFIASLDNVASAPIRLCSGCLVQNRLGARFCAGCGQSLATSISGAMPLIVREMEDITRVPDFEPRFIWLPGRNEIIFTDICQLEHEPSCAVHEIAPTLQRSEHYCIRCERCGVYVRSVGLSTWDVEKGERRSLATGLMGDMNPDASANGRKVAFACAFDKKIWQVDVDSGQLEQITSGDGIHLCPWYLSGGVVGYVQAEKLLADPPLVLGGKVHFLNMASGRVVNSVSCVSNISTLDITRGHFAVLTGKAEVALLSSRDAFCSVREIHLGAIPQWGSVSRLVLSPDGKYLMVGYYDTDHLFTGGYGGWGPGNKQLTIHLEGLPADEHMNFSVSAVWSPDKRHVADPKSGVWELLRDMGWPLVLFEPYREWQKFHWSPDGRKLLGERNSGQIWALNPDGAERQYLTEGYDPRWSPDGKWVVFLRSSGQRIYELWVMRVESADASYHPDVRAPSSLVHPERVEPAWSRDVGQPPEQDEPAWLKGIGQLVPQSVLAGRYTILQELGQNAMGSEAVYQAADVKQPGTHYVIREMSDAPYTDPQEKQEARESFRRQAELLAPLRHPNIPRAVEFFDQDGKLYLVTEEVEGESLGTMLSRRGGPFPETQVRAWAAQLCDVLDYLHRQIPPIIHRDVKPENIMVGPSGAIKLVEFGIARLYKPGQDKDTVPLGTPGYAPPELYGQGQTDARSDIYALGVTLHQLLTGRDPTETPFQFEPVRKLNPAVSRPMEQVVMRALEKLPERRWQSVREMRDAL